MQPRSEAGWPDPPPQARRCEVPPARYRAADLIADFTTGIPGDHLGAFARPAGVTWITAHRTTPGTANYVTLLEIGYALHELVFAILFDVALPVLLLVQIPRFFEGAAASDANADA